MQRTLSTILSFLLLFGITAEQVVPCVDAADLCVAESDAAKTDDGHAHDDGSTGDHHDECGDCVCPCHAPTLRATTTSVELTQLHPDYPTSPVTRTRTLGYPPPGPIPLI